MGIQRVVCMFCFGDACDVFVFYRMLPDSADGIAFFPLCVCVCVCVLSDKAIHGHASAAH